MLNINNRNIAEIRIGEKIIASIYNGIKPDLSFANACFGWGFWRNDKP